MKPQAWSAVELLSCSQNSPCAGLAQLPVSAAEVNERIGWVSVSICSYSLDVQTVVLVAWVEVWEIGCGLVLLGIRVHFLGQDSFQVVITSRQCCAVMYFWLESLTLPPNDCVVFVSRVVDLVLPLGVPAKEQIRGGACLSEVMQERGLPGWGWEEETLVAGRHWIISVVNETAARDLCGGWWFSLALLLIGILFCCRLWQHLWKTTRSTWFRQCSRSCPLSGTPLQKAPPYILCSEWLELEQSKVNSLMPSNDWNTAEGHGTRHSQVPQMGVGICGVNVPGISGTSGGSSKFLLA